MLRKLSFLILTVLLLSFTFHKYYVSIADVELNPSSQAFEISIKFIGHDLEMALAHSGVPNLYLETPKENPKTDAYLFQYIQKHFQIRIDDKIVPFSFVGKEVRDDDFIYCYLESKKVNKFKKIQIKNTLLTEKFSEQSNIVYLKLKNKKFNPIFTKEKRSIYYNIK